MCDSENSSGSEYARYLEEFLQEPEESPNAETAPLPQQQEEVDQEMQSREAEKNEVIPDVNLEAVDQGQRNEIEEPPKFESMTPGLNQEVHHQEEQRCDKSPVEQRSEQSFDQEDIIGCVEKLDAALNACLQFAENKGTVPVHGASSSNPQESMTQVEAALATELDQVTSDFPARAYQAYVDKHSKEFMEAAQKLRRYFIRQQLPSKPPTTSAERLRKEIAAMEEELNIKNEMLLKSEKQVLDWRKELKDHLEKVEAAANKV